MFLRQRATFNAQIVEPRVVAGSERATMIIFGLEAANHFSTSTEFGGVVSPSVGSSSILAEGWNVVSKWTQVGSVTLLVVAKDVQRNRA